MRRPGLSLMLMCLCLTCCLMATQAAAVTYQGTYAIIDPYSSADMSYLDQAAMAACPQTGTLTSPFCGSTSGTQAMNGIYLHIQWCSFELYHDGTSAPPLSCHYYLPPASNSPAAALDNQSPCNVAAGYTGYPYDTCQHSVLAKALQDITTINSARHSANLPALRVSLGLEAGVFVPLSYILPGSTPPFVGYEDLPVSFPSMNAGCGRLPNVWTNTYIAAYDAAMDELISVVNSYANGNIQIVKVTPITSATNEFDMDGRYNFIGAPSDPGTTLNQGPLMDCPGQRSPFPTGASVWLNDYNSSIYNANAAFPDCTFYVSIAQATECVIGSAIGHVRATLKNGGMSAAIMNIPTNGTNILFDIDCGAQGTSVCAVAADGTDQAKEYYFFTEIENLVNSGTPAYLAASYAFTANHGIGAFALSPSQISTTWTGLNLDPDNPTANFFADAANPNNATAQITCALNNTDPNHAAAFVLASGTVSGLLGPGIVIG